MKIFILFLILIPIFMSAQNNPRNIELNWKTDTSKHAVPLNEFTALMKPDGIPPIDFPKFWNKEKATANYFKHEPVIAVEIGGKAKAYPLSVLMFHEIVNDEINGVPFSATYCPLCNAALVFDRRFDEQLLTFKKTKKGFVDNETGSVWSITGKCISGKLKGKELRPMPHGNHFAFAWFAFHPECEIYKD